MTETDVKRWPEVASKHERGSVGWLIDQLNNHDPIDHMVAEKMRAQATALTAAHETIDAQRERIAGMERALSFYDKEVEGCRKLGREGDVFRQSLHNDGGAEARAALSAERQPS